jgi:hypothetical protein
MFIAPTAKIEENFVKNSITLLEFIPLLMGKGWQVLRQNVLD